MSSVPDISIGNMTQVVTELKVLTAGIEWKIKNFCMTDLRTYIESPAFYSQDNECAWSLILYPKKVLPSSLNKPGEYIAFEVKRLDNNKLSSVKYSMHLLVNSFTKVEGEILNFYCSKDNCYKVTFIIKRSELLESKNWKSLKNNATIVCKVYVLKDITSERNDSNKNCHIDNVVEDLAKMLIVPDFSDITIIAGEKKFKLHKAMLAARSPVFAAMFKSEMQEASENVVKVSHVSPEVLDEALHFIYTGRTSKLKDMVEDLFKVADYYAIKDLRETCISEMLSNLTKSNSLNRLLLLENYDVPEFKEKLKAYITKNIREIIHTEEWKAMVNSHPHITNDIYEDFIKRL